MRKAKLSLIIIICLTITACSPFFMREDEPIIYDNSTGLAEEQTLMGDTSSISIENINTELTNGLVHDISDDGEWLLISTSTLSTHENESIVTNDGTSLNVYNLKDNQLMEVAGTPNLRTNALFDMRNEGILYMEYDRDPKGSIISDSFRLNWTNYAGSTTKRISDSNESVSPFYSLIDDELLVYGNQKGQVHLIRTKDIPKNEINRKTYQLTDRLDIYKVDYFKDYNIAFFLVKNSTSQNMDLYYGALEKTDIEPILLEENVTDFSLSRENNSVLYNVRSDNNNKLYNVDIFYNKNLIYEGPLSMFFYSNNSNKILYSVRTDETSNNQNLWMMNTDGSKNTQVASNLKIAGNQVLFNPKERAIYFSVLNLLSNDTLDYKVYSIEYTFS